MIEPIDHAILSVIKDKNFAEHQKLSVALRLVPVIDCRNRITLAILVSLWGLLLIQLVFEIIGFYQLDKKPEIWPCLIYAVLLMAKSAVILLLFARGKLEMQKATTFSNANEFLKHFLAKSTTQSRACSLVIGLALICISYQDHLVAKHFQMQAPAQKLLGVLAMASVFVKQTSIWQSLFLLLACAVGDVLCTVTEATQNDKGLEQALETYWLALSASFVIRSTLMVAGLAGVRMMLSVLVQTMIKESERESA